MSSSWGSAMSAMGQKQTLKCRQTMSALPPKADIRYRDQHVRFVPKADILRCEKKCRYSIPLPSRQRDAAGFRTRGALDIERPKDRLLFAVGRNQVYSAFSAWRRAVGVCRYGPHAGPPTSARADP